MTQKKLDQTSEKNKGPQSCIQAHLKRSKVNYKNQAGGTEFKLTCQ